MKLTLNIGLSRPAGGENTIAETLAALPKGFGIEWKHRLNVGEWQGTPENTLVIVGEITRETDVTGLKTALAVTAEKLGQECIATLIEADNGESRGALIPPVDDFNPEFFIAY